MSKLDFECEHPWQDSLAKQLVNTILKLVDYLGNVEVDYQAAQDVSIFCTQVNKVF